MSVMTKEEFAREVRGYTLHMYRLAYSILNNSTDAEDAVSEAVLHAYEKLRTLRDPDSFKNDQSTREYYTEYLDLAMSHGCTAYTLEYAMDPTIRRQAAAYAGKHGYICYISDNIGLCLGR